MDLDRITNKYRKLSDEKITELAEKEAYKLEPEVIEILKTEIKGRNLSDSLLKSIEVLTQPLTEKDLQNYYTLISKTPCTYCGTKTIKNNVTMVSKTSSFIIFTYRDTNLKIACTDCLNKMHKQANTRTFFLGWWSFPWGPIQTIRTFIHNSKMKKRYNNTNQPTDLFAGFIMENRGILEAAISSNTPNHMRDFVMRMNQQKYIPRT